MALQIRRKRTLGCKKDLDRFLAANFVFQTRVRVQALDKATHFELHFAGRTDTALYQDIQAGEPAH